MTSVHGLSQVLRNLDAFERQMYQRVIAAGDEIGLLLANYAKTNHAWTPRTGMTDVSTAGGVFEATREYVRIVLSAGMSYDVFLETAREGRWSWLWPSVEANRGNIMSILRRHLEI